MKNYLSPKVLHYTCFKTLPWKVGISALAMGMVKYKDHRKEGYISDINLLSYIVY